MRSRCSRWPRSTSRAARRCRASRRAVPRSPSRPTSSAACFKTGRLFGAACALGGLFGGLDRPGIEALERFGEQLGIAFQLADDLLDCDGDPEATGKALGVDLLDGTVTLPLLLAAQRDEHVAAALLDRERAQADVVGMLARVAARARSPIRAAPCRSTPTPPAPRWTHCPTAATAEHSRLSCKQRPPATTESSMASTLTRTLIDPVREKVLAGERLDFDDGVALLESDDLLGLGELADQARRLRGGGDEVYFVNNLYLNHTNVCRVKCKFCAFARTNKQDGAYTWEIGPLTQHAVKRYEHEPYSEIHMVGGESPYLDLDYYLDLVRSLKAALPDVTLKCFTASEVHHMTKLSGLTHAEVLEELFAAGVETLPGGGAEVFADRVRKIVAPGKEHPDIWLEVHRLAHGMGVKTHCTMLYNHVETYEERVDHLLRLRDLQDETGGFMAFIPLPFHPENTVFERRGWTFTTGHDDLKMQAVSRLMLDNIEHIKAYWIMISTPLAQVALHFGANDIQGTVVEETIAHAAGAVTPTEEKVAELVRVIREAGRVPVQRDSFYNVVRRFD